MQTFKSEGKKSVKTLAVSADGPEVKLVVGMEIRTKLGIARMAPEDAMKLSKELERAAGAAKLDEMRRLAEVEGAL